MWLSAHSAKLLAFTNVFVCVVGYLIIFSDSSFSVLVFSMWTLTLFFPQQDCYTTAIISI